MQVEDGKLTPCERYEGVELAFIPGVGVVESWNEWFMPWLLEVPQIAGLRSGTQKTSRWPGYGKIFRRLVQLGLASKSPMSPPMPSTATVGEAVAEIIRRHRGSDQPITEEDAAMLAKLRLAPNSRQLGSALAGVSPKRLVDEIVGKACKLGKSERDLTIVTVEATGMTDKGRRKKVSCRMVDRASEPFTSMARTTAFTGAAITRLAALGRVAGIGGLLGCEAADCDLRGKVVTPEKTVRGHVREAVLSDIARHGVVFHYGEQDL